MDTLVAKLRADFPQFRIHAGDTFHWSSRTKEVFYEPGGNVCSLLHEVGHALLNHMAFATDMDLIAKEVAAWERARELAVQYAVTFDDNLVDRCLDTYRDWLYMRSTCPTCGSHGIQHAQKPYVCLNCGNTWKVSQSVLCRAYRQREVVLNAK